MSRMSVSVFFGSVFLLVSSSGFADGMTSAIENVDEEYAYECATEDANCYILDVRTNAEWRWVGHPGMNMEGDGEELEGKVVNISWLIMKKNQLISNKKFLRHVNKQFKQVKDEVELIAICRSGGRSLAAAKALDAAGYYVKNLTHGFEGARDDKGYRTENGWKVEDYPYNDSAIGGYHK